MQHRGGRDGLCVLGARALRERVWLLLLPLRVADCATVNAVANDNEMNVCETNAECFCQSIRRRRTTTWSVLKMGRGVRSRDRDRGG